MKAIILSRVSTKEQEEGHSIGAQRQRLGEYCEVLPGNRTVT